MIELGRAALHSEGVTLFPDHADPRRYYYLPDSPSLRLDAEGKPELTLLKYRLDSTLHEALGAGLLSLTVDLAVNEERLQRLRNRIAAREQLSNIKLVPVVADSGSCELILIDRSSSDTATDEAADGVQPIGFGLVERILGAATPALYGTNAAMFQAILGTEGVSLVEGALREGGLPAGVVYNLQTTAIRPALRAQITARWSSIYNYYENRLHGGRLLAAVEVGETTEDLVQNEAITIEIDELVPPDEQTQLYQRSIDQIQRYILEKLFKPSLGQAPPAEDTEADALATIGGLIKDIAGFFSLTYTLRDVDRNELKTFTYQLNVARAEKMTLAPQGTFQLLLDTAIADSDLREHIISVLPTPPSEMKFDVASIIDFQEDDIDHIEVFMTYGDKQKSFILDTANPRQEVSIWYEEAIGLTIKYEYVVNFLPGAAAMTDRLRSGEHSTDERIIRINPREIYQLRSVRAVLQGVPADKYPMVVMDIRAHNPLDGWDKEKTIELIAENPESTFTVRVTHEALIRFEQKLRYIDNQGGEFIVDWEPVEEGIVIIGDPEPDIMDVQILASARFGSEIQRLIVELRPRDEPNKVATRMLTESQGSAIWSLAVPESGDRSYEFRVTVHTVRNEVREGRWMSSTDTKLIVGEGIARLRQIEVLILGKTLQEMELMALKLHLRFEDAEAELLAEDEFLVQDTSQPIKWSYPVADTARQAYEYQLSMIHLDGHIELKDPVLREDKLLVIPLV